MVQLFVDRCTTFCSTYCKRMQKHFTGTCWMLDCWNCAKELIMVTLMYLQYLMEAFTLIFHRVKIFVHLLLVEQSWITLFWLERLLVLSPSQRPSCCVSLQISLGNTKLWWGQRIALLSIHLLCFLPLKCQGTVPFYIASYFGSWDGNWKKVLLWCKRRKCAIF